MTRGSTTIEFGPLSLFVLHTHAIEQVPIYDPSGTDLMHWKYNVRVSGIMHGFLTWCQRHAVTGEVVTTGGASGQHKLIRVQLKPRQKFVMKMGVTASEPNGTTILEAEPFPEWEEPAPGGETPEEKPDDISGFDVNNGPRCVSFTANQFGANDVWKIEATFEICKVECDKDSQVPGNTKGVLSNRWSVQDTIDKEMRTTRTYTGTLRVASNQYNPQMFRSLVVPPLQPYFRRDSMNFLVTEDGLNLRYTITDVEIAVAAPKPLTSWNITHVESLQDAMNLSSELTVDMIGDSKADKTQMIEIGIYLVYGLLLARTPDDPAVNDFMLENLTITDYIGDVNRVVCFARIRKEPKNGVLLNAMLQSVGRVITPDILPGFAGGPPGNDYSQFLSRGAREGELPELEGPAALVGIFSCYLQTPCDNEHAMVPESVRTPENTNEVTSLNGQIEVSANIVPDLPEDNNETTSESHKQNLYTFYRMETIPERSDMVAVMPLAVSQFAESEGDPPDTCVFINLAGPQSRRRVRIHAERVNAWPEMPDDRSLEPLLASGGRSLRLIKSRRLMGTPEVTALGQKIYRCRFDCVFAETRPPQSSEALSIGRNVWTSPSFGGNETTTSAATDGWAGFIT